MTLQVGLIGTDGIVIASDRQLQQQQTVGLHVGVSQSLTSKFRFGQNGVLGCWSGDKVAQLALDYFMHLPSADVEQAWEDSLVSRANDAWQAVCSDNNALGDQIRKVLVARPCTPCQLWVVDVERKSFANPVLNKVVAGDIRNSARHIINSYFSEPYAPLPFSVSQLIFAAAHAIVRGERENHSSVRGLEVVVIRNEQRPVFLTTYDIERLTARSDQFSVETKASLVTSFETADSPDTPTGP
jgi:hypothetical protein